MEVDFVLMICFFHNDILKYVFKGGKCVTSTVGIVSNKDQFEGTVAQFGMEIVPIAPDGNCFFQCGCVFNCIEQKRFTQSSGSIFIRYSGSYFKNTTATSNC